MLFAIDMTTKDESRKQVFTPNTARFHAAIHQPTVTFLRPLCAALLFCFKPVFWNHCGYEAFVSLAAVFQIACVDRVREEGIVAIDVLKQACSGVDFAVGCAGMSHLPGEIGAIPHLRIRNNPLDNTGFASSASLFPLVHPNLNALTFEASRNTARHHAQIRPSAHPVRVISEKFGVVVTSTDELRQPTFGILRDFIERLFILPLLKGFNQRINGGVPSIGGGYQVDDRDPTQPQICLDIGGFDAISTQPIRLPEDHTERLFTSRFLALIAVIDVFEAATQVGKHFLKLIAFFSIRGQLRLIDVELIQHEVVMLTVFTSSFDLLRDAAILFLTTGVTAVDNNMRARWQRAVLPDEVKVTGVIVHTRYSNYSLIRWIQIEAVHSSMLCH